MDLFSEMTKSSLDKKYVYVLGRYLGNIPDWNFIILKLTSIFNHCHSSIKLWVTNIRTAEITKNENVHKCKNDPSAWTFFFLKQRSEKKSSNFVL